MRPFRTVATDFLARFPDPYEDYRSSSRTPPPPPPRSQKLRRTVSQPSTFDDISQLYRSAKKRLLDNMKEIDPLIGQYTHLQDMPQADVALQHLRKLASCVKPLMRKRGWRVGTLSEIFPQQRNLLGLNQNRGEIIMIRLRHPDNQKFLPFESTLDTMLHELSHIVQGPHDALFQATWDELRAEWETLSLKGFTGEGFLGKGQKVGGGLIPRDEMRRRARVEAQKRDHRRQKESANRGVRVGGSRPIPGFTARDAAAEATLRRTKATEGEAAEGCGTGTKAGAQAAADALLNGFRTQAEMDEANANAIQAATMELMTQEEEQVLIQTRAELPPMSGGLEWDPIEGLRERHSGSTSTVRPESSGTSKTIAKAASSTRQSYHPPAVPVQTKPSSSYHPPPVPTKTKPSASSSRAPGASIHHTRRPVMAVRPSRPVSRVVKEEEERQRQKKLSKKPPEGNPVQRWLAAVPAYPNNTTSNWQCVVCTLINDSRADSCDACTTSRSSGPAPRSIGIPPPITNTDPYANIQSLGWSCMQCGNYMEQHWWTCNVCGHMKDHS